jgi:hypothetical protein
MKALNSADHCVGGNSFLPKTQPSGQRVNVERVHQCPGTITSTLQSQGKHAPPIRGSMLTYLNCAGACSGRRDIRTFNTTTFCSSGVRPFMISLDIRTKSA